MRSSSGGGGWPETFSRRIAAAWPTGRSSSLLADRARTSELAKALESSPLPPELLDQKETKDQLLLALTQLPSEAQELIAGRYFRGWTVERLADTLGLSLRAAEGRLYRARQALKQALAHLEE